MSGVLSPHLINLIWEPEKFEGQLGDLKTPGPGSWVLGRGAGPGTWSLEGLLKGPGGLALETTKRPGPGDLAQGPVDPV